MTRIDRARLEAMLGGVVRAGGTALHLMPGRAPWIRLEGRVVPLGDEAISGDDLRELLREFLFADHRQRLERGEEVDVLFATAAGDRFRTAILPQVDGTNVVFRRVPDRVPSFPDAGLPEMMAAFTSFRSGLVLLTGFHGSGKRTTLAALIERINAERAVHVVTIERQIEFVHASRSALIHQREIGTHVSSAADGVRQACRQAADVIVVADLEDGDALEATLDAVDRGRLVLACFEASCVAAAVTRLPKLVDGEQRDRIMSRLAGAFRAIVSQTLVRRRHGRGRVPVLEILVRNEAASRAIRCGAAEELPKIMRAGAGLGMQTADMALRGLLQTHEISAEEADWHATDRDLVRGLSLRT